MKPETAKAGNLLPGSLRLQAEEEVKLLGVFGAPVAAYLLVTRRDVDVRRLWLFVGVVYVLGLGPYALFRAYPLLSTFIVGLVLQVIALVGILAVVYYLVYERRVGERVTA